jgi:general stress protein YciG
METPKKSSKAKTIFSVIIFIGVLWYFFGGGMDKQVANDMQKIENQVATDAEKQYEIAKKGGDKMQTYVQASLVAAAYLQAKDEVNYNKWKAIEKEEAKNAGMPAE